MARKLDTEVLVIGGGATGTGVIYDLALRGFRCALVEKRDLTHGTTGRYHGLLHSGGRYAVKDPEAAAECIRENGTLRRIMPHCLEDTGGFFVTTPWDDPDYGDRFLAGCRAAGIPCQEIEIDRMLAEEPALNPDISRCFRVPDAAADSFLAAHCNAEAARNHGAQILTYHELKRLLRQGDTVIGAVCHDLVNDQEVTILADMVVNATGAWAGQIARTVGVEVNVVPGKGTMVALNHRVINTVVNRCKMPADGDIIVPIHTVAVVGTTDERVADPERFAIEPWEIQLMLDEGEKLIPGMKEMRVLRAWAGVRPLFQEKAAADTRDITRAFTLLEHQARDGVSGFITITGGKWTTYRLMAEATVDQVCANLDTRRPCRTHLELLPDILDGGPGYHSLGARLGRTERSRAYGDLVCECEMATREDVEHSIHNLGAETFDDVRRDVRLGMGPCQGGFCAYRVTGMLQSARGGPVEAINVALRDFLQERWKGLLPILWGDQLKQERLDELIYLSVLNADRLPGQTISRLGPAMYEPPADEAATVDA